jgi:mannose-6-phosphate isomerase
MDRLDNQVRNYAWGSAEDIPAFLGIPADGSPVGELWIGAHPDLPSRLVRNGATQSLADVIRAQPEAELGPEVANSFGERLPFLLKVIAAARPLSLQVHPTKQYTEQAYARQQQTPGAPRDYTDDNHKPELICALRDGFVGLCGFRPVADTRQLLAGLDLPGLADIASQLDPQDPAGSLRSLVTALLTATADCTPLIAAIRAACERTARAGGRWAPACAAYASVAAAFPADPAVLVALLLNYVRLSAGEAVFVDAGVPHCYLSGLGVELMASSDNVLRAGLTSKQVNVPELLRVLDCSPGRPEVLRPVSQPGDPDRGSGYPVPVADFRLSRLELADEPTTLPSGTPQILLSIGGTARLRDGAGRELELRRGQSAYLPATDNGVTVAGHGTALRATVGTQFAKSAGS